MQHLILLLLTISFMYGSFQTKTASQPAAMGKKDSLLSKAWTFIGIEEFGVINKVKDSQKQDGAIFSLDKKASITMEGNTKTGMWSLDKPKTMLTVAFDNSSEKRTYKVIRLVEDSLTIEYKDSALVKTRYHYLKK